MTCSRYHRVGAEEEAACHRIKSISNNIGVTDKTGQTMPVGKIDFSFRPVKDGLPKRDGKANRRVIDLIVIGIVIHQPPEIIYVQPDLLKEGFGQTQFVIISL